MPSLLIDIAANVARMQNDMTAATKSVKGFADNASKSLDMLKTAFYAVGGTYGVKSLITGLFDAGVAAERMQLQLSAATKSVSAAQSAWNFLAQESERLGLVMEDQVNGFVKIAAAAQGTRLEGQATRDIWLAMAEAGAALQMRSADVEGALLAVSQMISKGKVSAEELRQQLGERLPGAFQVAAQAMGVTTAQLDDMLKKGQVIADDFLPKFAAALHEQYGQAAVDASESAQAALNRLTNTWNDLARELGANFVPAAQEVIQWLADLTRSLNDFLGTSEQGQQNMLLKTLEAQLQEAKRLAAEFEGVASGSGTFDAALSWIPGYITQEEAEYGLRVQQERIKNIQETIRTAQAEFGFEDRIEEYKKLAQEEYDAYYLPTMRAEEELTRKRGEEVKRQEEERKALAKLEKELLAERMRDYEKQAKDEYDAYFAPTWQAEQALLEYKRKVDDEALEYRISQYTVLAEQEEQAYNAKVQSLDKYLMDYAEHVRRYGTLSQQMYIGVKSALDYMVINHRDAYAQMYQLTLDFAQNSRWSLSEFFYDAMSGDLESFGDYWESFWDRMKNSLSRTFADMAMSWAESQIRNVLTGSGSGSMSSILNAIGGAWNYLGSAASSAVSSVVSWVGGLFHEGGFVGDGNQQRVIGNLRSDEVLAILQKGEMVLTQDQVAALMAVMSAGAGPAAPVVGGQSGYMSLGQFSDTLGNLAKGIITMNPMTFAKGIANIIAYDQLGMNLGQAIMSPMTFAELAAINELGGFAQAWGDDLGTPGNEGLGLMAAMAALEAMGAAPTPSTPGVTGVEFGGYVAAPSDPTGMMGADYGGGYAGYGFGPGGGMSFGEAMGILGAMGAGSGGGGGGNASGGVAPAEGSGYARGGIVPRDQLAKVHKGEGVFTPEQLEHLSIAGEQPITVVVPVYIDGKKVSETVYEGMYDASRRKQVTLHQRAVEGYTGTAGLDLPTQ